MVLGPSGNSNRKILSQTLVCKDAGLKCQHDVWCMTRTKAQGRALQDLEHFVTSELCLLGDLSGAPAGQNGGQNEGGQGCWGLEIVSGPRQSAFDGPPPWDTLAAEHLSMLITGCLKSPL